MYEDPKSKISLLEKVLDSREDRVFKKTKRHELHDRPSDVSQEWDDTEFKDSEEPSVSDNQMLTSSGKTRENSLSMKILVGSIIFFVIALLVVAINFLGRGNLISGNNIEVTVKAPVSVAGGEVLPFEIEIKNNNNITLTGADLGVTFPAGTREALDNSKLANRVQTYIGDILPGQSIKKNMSVILFGSENEKKDINIVLEYKVTGSNSLFTKNKKVPVLISSAPVNVVVTGPSEINTNQKVDFNIEITSNSPSVLKDLLLKVEYPFGFSFISSDPKTFSKNNLWLIGDLEPGAKRTIKLSGSISGQEGEERGFNFSLGSQSKNDDLLIDVPFASSFSSVTIRRPFVSADMYFNGVDTAEYVSRAGAEIETIIKWKNNLSYEVTDVVFVVTINGNSVDKSSVQVDDGLYRSIENTIIFNKTTDKQLASLEPGEEGESKFSFKSFGINSVTGSGLINPTIIVDVSVGGKKIAYDGVTENVFFSDSRKVKITSNPQLFAKALYYVGPFQNTGPVPPKAEKETTYTITWTVTNPLNALSGARVSAVLPPYIKWLSAVSPQKEKVDYDPNTGSVIWSIGNIPAGAGIVSSAKEVSFQVSFMPSVDQIGTIPNLVRDAVLDARDNFTMTNVSASFPVLNTRLSNDPYFKVDAEKVVQ
jgi:hypothetical protein